MKIISCKIFETYIQDFINQGDEIVYLDIQLHNYPNKLTKLIQQEIDHTDCKKILILYGLCGNALLNIDAKEKEVIIIRAHDCLSILLGGYQKYIENFGKRKSASWTCRGLLVNDGGSNLKDYQQWVIDYGIEEAEYLKSVLCQPCHIYIQMDKEDVNSHYQETIIGDITYLKDIIHLSHEDLLVLYKNEKLRLTNDRKVLEKYHI